MKLKTPRVSKFTTRLHGAHYAAAFSARYQAQRDLFLLLAHSADSIEVRETYVDAAKSNHRNFLRCLREARS